jgi:hypothetical protein
VHDGPRADLCRVITLPGDCEGTTRGRRHLQRRRLAHSSPRRLGAAA